MSCEEMKSISLEEKSILITGATSGIGLAAAAELSKRGAFVIGVGRDEGRNQLAVEKISSENSDAKIHYILADLSTQEQVIKLAVKVDTLLAKFSKNALDVLINNAGVYLEKKSCTQDGIEKTFAVNHLAPFLLSHELLPLLNDSEQARLLTVSSYSHRTTPMFLSRLANPWPYFGLLAYKRSKLCNVLFTYELNRRMDGKVLAFAVDPGLVNTAIASKGSDGISDWVWRFRREQGTSPDLPAKTIAFLSGSEKIDTSQGFYFKDCSPIPPSIQARDEKLAEELWGLSCELTNVDWR